MNEMKCDKCSDPAKFIFYKNKFIKTVITDYGLDNEYEKIPINILCANHGPKISDMNPGKEPWGYSPTEIEWIEALEEPEPIVLRQPNLDTCARCYKKFKPRQKFKKCTVTNGKNVYDTIRRGLDIEEFEYAVCNKPCEPKTYSYFSI